MSGTSLDGIDAVVASFETTPRLIASHHTSFSANLRDALNALQSSGTDELHRMHVAANMLSAAYASCILELLSDAKLKPEEITAAGCHGQTVRHRPDVGYTAQIVNGALLAELINIDVICDFRSRDIAAGGQGAPLVPAFHAALFGSDTAHRVIVNIGGITNLTDLPPGGTVRGFDCGPGNILMDGWIARWKNQPYDAGGVWARSGRVNETLLASLLQEPFFALRPPKSTGRDLFNLAWLEQKIGAQQLPDADVQATLCELTARTITNAVNVECSGVEEIFLCGGGARNVFLVERLQGLLQRPVSPTDKLGVDVQWVEAFAFAWLAQQTVLRAPGNLSAVTGASGPRVLGAIYPAH